MMNLYFYDDFGQYIRTEPFDLTAVIPGNTTFVAPPEGASAWVFKGGCWIIDPEIELVQLYNLPPVPEEVSAFQAFSALEHFGLLSIVETYMASMAVPVRTKLAWQKADVFKRHSDMILSVADALNLSTAQVDELFLYAATVQ